MDFSVCILLNKWHDKLPLVIAALNDLSSEILLGTNGDFDIDQYPELLKFNHLNIFPLKWDGYGATKNNLAKAAKNDWILSLDSDEVVDSDLKYSISNINWQNERQVFAFSMTHFLGNKPLYFGAWGKGKKSFYRLYHRQFTSWDEADVHESIQRPPNAILVKLKGKINHYTASNFEELLEKNKKYAQLSATKYKKQKKYIFPGRAFISSSFNFIKEYIFQLGFLDGKAGFLVAKGNFLYTFWKYSL